MSEEGLKKLWVEKYRPNNLDDYIFHNEHHKTIFTNMIEEQSIPHLLLSGVQGSGKTTIARILIDNLNIDKEMDVKTINASDNNSVDFVRDQLKSFVTTYSFSPFKIVHLEECDYLTLSGQAILRGIMEDYADEARFILTCNYDHKIMPAIASRCQHFHFKSSNKNDIAEYIAKILIKEHVIFDIDTIDKFIAVGYPDIRKITQMVQQCSSTGKLIEPSVTANVTNDYKFEILELLTDDKWFDIRKILCKNVSNEEWQDVYRFLYENLQNSKKFNNTEKYEAGIISIAEYMYKDSIVADREINAAAMFIELGQI